MNTSFLPRIFRGLLRPRRYGTILFKLLIRAHQGLIHKLFGEHPIGLGYWKNCHFVAGLGGLISNPLVLTDWQKRNSGNELKIAKLQKVLSGYELGIWPLDQWTIQLLWRILHRENPRIILECGAGVGTLILAKFLSEVPYGGTKPRIISLEQDMEYKNAVEEGLKKHELSSYVNIVHAPLNERDEYGFNDDLVTAKMGGGKADMLLIDGPKGPPGCRITTLPRLAQFCRPGARWYLDDSFRDGEMNILQNWSSIPGVHVEGIYPVGKGLGCGSVSQSLANSSTAI